MARCCTLGIEICVSFIFDDQQKKEALIGLMVLNLQKNLIPHYKILHSVFRLPSIHPSSLPTYLPTYPSTQRIPANQPASQPASPVDTSYKNTHTLEPRSSSKRAACWARPQHPSFFPTYIHTYIHTYPSNIHPSHTTCHAFPFHAKKHPSSRKKGARTQLPAGGGGGPERE